MKKALSLILALAMMAALACVPAMAADEEEPYVAGLLNFEGVDDNWASSAAPMNVELTSHVEKLEDDKERKSIKIDCIDPADDTATNFAGIAFYTLGKTANLTNYRYMEVDLYVGVDLTGKQAGFGLNLVTDKNSGDGFNQMAALDNSPVGWKTIRFNLNEVEAAVEGADWANINRMRFSFTNPGGLEEMWFLLDEIRLVDCIDPSKPTIDPFYQVIPDDVPCVILDCEDEVNGWLTANDVELTLDTEHKTEGEASIKYFPFNPTASGNLDNPIGGIAIYRFEEPIDCTNYTYLEVDFYVGSQCSPSEGMQVNMGTGREDGYNHMFVLNEKRPGWYTYQVDLLDNPQVEVDLANIDTMRFMWMNYNLDHQDPDQYFLIDNVRLTGIKDKSKPAPVPEKYPVTGKVQAGETGVALDTVTVALHKVMDNGNIASAAYRSLKANADGTYKFAKIADGDYAIRIRAVDGKYDLVEKRFKVEGAAVTVEDITLTYTPPAFVYGDVTGEGEIDSVDALAILQHNVGILLDEQYLEPADVYQDGSIDSTDALCVLQYIVGLEKELPIIPAQ